MIQFFFALVGDGHAVDGHEPVGGEGLGVVLELGHGLAGVDLVHDHLGGLVPGHAGVAHLLGHLPAGRRAVGAAGQDREPIEKKFETLFCFL